MQIKQIGYKVKTRDYACDDVGQVWVAHYEPSSRRDAVGFVLEFLRPHLEKVVEPARPRPHTPIIWSRDIAEKWRIYVRKQNHCGLFYLRAIRPNFQGHPRSSMIAPLESLHAIVVHKGRPR